MPTPEQLKKIWLLSDKTLYPEAVSFVRRLVQVETNDPLPISQVNGLFNIAASNNYDALRRFVLHQRDRNWPSSKQNIRRFYASLDDVLGKMQRERLRNEFHLLQDVPGRSVVETRQEMDTLLSLLAREFIQHVLAENNVLLQQFEEERKRGRGGDRGRDRNRQQSSRGGGYRENSESNRGRQQNSPQRNNRRESWQ